MKRYWFNLTASAAEVTPPVGFNLFVLQNMPGTDSNTIAKAALFPQIVTCLHDLVMGKEK